MKLLPQVRTMLRELDAALLEMFEVPSECLNPALRNKGETTTLKAAYSRYLKLKAKSEAKQAVKTKKLSRAELVAKYRANIENGVDIEYVVNEERQTANMLAFCQGAERAGWIELEDAA